MKDKRFTTWTCTNCGFKTDIDQAEDGWKYLGQDHLYCPDCMKSKEYTEAVLTNDEASTDEELVELFMTELQISQERAQKIVSKRDHFLKS